MFLKNLKNFKFPKLASSFHTSLPSQYTLPKAKIDFDLLSPFDKSKTIQALNQVHQATATQKNVFNPLDIKILDKTGSTSYSQTFRAYDKESNVLFAQKKLFLDSASSWNQLNLILKQYTIQSPHLASIYSLTFDEKNQQVNVVSEVNKNTIGDYSQFMEKQNLRWTDELLMSYTQQILSQLKVLRLMNAHCEAPIKSQNMFIDRKYNNLKVFDFSDFQIPTEDLETARHENIFLDIALQTVVQALNPNINVRSLEEARTYLSKSYPSFYEIIKDDLTLNPNTKNYPLYVVGEYDEFISKKLGLFESKGIVVNIPEEEGFEDWKQFKENIETGYLKQIEAHSLLGNQKLMAEAYERLFLIKEKIIKAQEEARLNTFQGLVAEEKESLAYRSTSGLLSLTGYVIQFVLGFILSLLFLWGFFVALISIMVAGDKIYHGVQEIISPAKQEQSLDQKDDKDVNKNQEEAI